jgi:hypothetical protein
MSSEIFTYTKQISRSNYFSEEEFMNRIETIIKDHYENFISEYFTIKDTFFRFEKTEIITGDIVKFYENNVELSFDLIDFDNIVCYPTATQTYSGIDEYAIENFKLTDFAGREHIQIKEYYGPDFPIFGQHPLENVHYEFEKRFIYPKMENFIKKHYGT